MVHPSDLAANLDALHRFWRRTPFHDMAIEEVSALNRRVIIRLEEFTLVVTGSSGLERCELPAVWLYETITPHSGGFRLNVETDTGQLTTSGADVRLIRNRDLALLVPPIDA